MSSDHVRPLSASACVREPGLRDDLRERGSIARVRAGSAQFVLVRGNSARHSPAVACQRERRAVARACAPCRRSRSRDWCEIGSAYRSAPGSIGSPDRRPYRGAMTTTTQITLPEPFYVMQDLVTLHAGYGADRRQLLRDGGRGGARRGAAAAAHASGFRAQDTARRRGPCASLGAPPATRNTARQSAPDWGEKGVTDGSEAVPHQARARSATSRMTPSYGSTGE